MIREKNFILKFSRLPYQLEPEKGLEDKIQVIVSGVDAKRVGWKSKRKCFYVKFKQNNMWIVCVVQI